MCLVTAFQMECRSVFDFLEKNQAVDLSAIHRPTIVMSLKRVLEQCEEEGEWGTPAPKGMPGQSEYLVLFPVTRVCDDGPVSFCTTADTRGAAVDCLVARLPCDSAVERNKSLRDVYNKACRVGSATTCSVLWMVLVVPRGHEPAVYPARPSWHLSIGHFFPHDQCIRTVLAYMHRRTALFNAMLTLLEGQNANIVSPETAVAIVYPNHFRQPGCDGEFVRPTGVTRVLDNSHTNRGAVWLSMFKQDVARYPTMLLARQTL